MMASRASAVPRAGAIMLLLAIVYVSARWAAGMVGVVQVFAPTSVFDVLMDAVWVVPPCTAAVVSSWWVFLAVDTSSHKRVWARLWRKLEDKVVVIADTLFAGFGVVWVTLIAAANVDVYWCGPDSPGSLPCPDVVWLPALGALVWLGWTASKRRPRARVWEEGRATHKLDAAAAALVCAAAVLGIMSWY